MTYVVQIHTIYHILSAPHVEIVPTISNLMHAISFCISFPKYDLQMSF